MPPAAALVRSMDCYYSNLIEGHNTHPRDIDRALHRDYSTEPKRRALQLEAVAHIEVQQAIDEGRDDSAFPASAAYILAQAMTWACVTALSCSGSVRSVKAETSATSR